MGRVRRADAAEHPRRSNPGGKVVGRERGRQRLTYSLVQNHVWFSNNSTHKEGIQSAHANKSQQLDVLAIT